MPPKTGQATPSSSPGLLSSSPPIYNDDEDFEIPLAEGGEYTAQGMQLALIQKIPFAKNAQIHIQSIDELRRQFAEQVRASQQQPVVIALNTPNMLDAGRAHWSLIVIDKGNVCYCNTLTSDFRTYENEIRTLAENAHAAAFRGYDVEALNHRHEIAEVDDMNLGACGYWVESITGIVLREFDGLMQGRPALLVQGLREAIDGDLDNFVRQGFERWTSRHDSISFNQLQRLIAEYGVRQAAASNEKRKSHLQALIRHADEVSKAIEKLHPESGIRNLYESINMKFNAAVAREKNLDKNLMFTLQHWERMTELMNTALAALKLSQDHHLKTPSSFSNKFGADKSNNKIKDLITFVEMQAKVSFVAFEEPPIKSPTEYLKHVIASLKAAIANVNNALQTEQRSSLIIPMRVLLDVHLPKLLQAKPHFKNILTQARAISASLDYDNVDVNGVVNKLLFSIYLETYKISREKKLLSSSKVHDEITPWLEKILVERCPQIKTVVPHEGVQNTLTNRILYFAGERYGEFVNQTRAELLALGNAPEPKDTANENKKRFVNTGKLLGRLGRAGFNASADILAGKKGQYVKESDIEKYYDENIAEIAVSNRNRK